MIKKQFLVNKLRELGFIFKRSGAKNDVWKKKGTVDRVTIPRSKLIAEATARSILKQAGATPEEIQDFIRDCRS